jgi:hypothetical protein
MDSHSVTFTHSGWYGFCPIYTTEHSDQGYFARYELHGFLRFNAMLVQLFLDTTILFSSEDVLTYKPYGVKELDTHLIVTFS